MTANYKERKLNKQSSCNITGKQLKSNEEKADKFDCFCILHMTASIRWEMNGYILYHVRDKLKKYNTFTMESAYLQLTDIFLQGTLEYFFLRVTYVSRCSKITKITKKGSFTITAKRLSMIT